MAPPPRTAEDLLAGLDPEQRAVAETLRGPVRVLAGAGTGKTRAITHRIAYGVATGTYAPTEVLAVTFTTRAAGEMRGRLRDLGAPGVQARTFHSAALRQLRFFWPRVHGRDLPELTESKLPLLGRAASRLRLGANQTLLRDLAAEVEWAKVSNVTPDAYVAVAGRRGREVSGVGLDEVARVLAAYEEVKRDAGRMDMEDVLLLTAALLADDERVAAQVRSQYRWFVVDEFQDVSPLQWSLLRLWLGGRDEVCVVGDPAQTIYSFAGADARYLRDFTSSYPEARALELVRNYRSTPQVVGAANQLLAGTPSKGVDLVAQRPGGVALRAGGHPDEVAEAEAVAEQVRRLRDAGTPLRDVAVLFRINAQSEAFEDALAARGLPYVIRGGVRFFDRQEVRQAVTLLRGAVRAGEDGTESGAGSDGAPAAEGGLVGVVRARFAGLGWTTEAPRTRGQARDRWESWQALVDQAVDFAAGNPEAGLADFVDELDRRAGEQHAPVADGVTLATLHAAKGLEWEVVFLAGLVEGTLPITYAETPAEIEEERRLLYVGVTRARTELHLSWASARQPGGRASRRPSRFLDGMVAPTLLDRAGSTGSGRGTRTSRKAVHCRECGKPLDLPADKKLGRHAGCAASYDEELYERLRGWRRQRAAADEVPAYVVFTDATLQLVAEHRPRDEQGLLRIAGVGPSKVERYAADVLAVVAGRAVDDAAG